jgi:hypothetical protein
MGKREAARFAQVKKILDLFKEAHGREPEGADEIERWLSTPEGKKALARDGKK